MRMRQRPARRQFLIALSLACAWLLARPVLTLGQERSGIGRLTSTNGSVHFTPSTGAQRTVDLDVSGSFQVTNGDGTVQVVTTRSQGQTTFSLTATGGGGVTVSPYDSTIVAHTNVSGTMTNVSLQAVGAAPNLAPNNGIALATGTTTTVTATITNTLVEANIWNTAHFDAAILSQNPVGIGVIGDSIADSTQGSIEHYAQPLQGILPWGGGVGWYNFAAKLLGASYVSSGVTVNIDTNWYSYYSLGDGDSLTNYPFSLDGTTVTNPTRIILAFTMGPQECTNITVQTLAAFDGTPTTIAMFSASNAGPNIGVVSNWAVSGISGYRVITKGTKRFRVDTEGLTATNHCFYMVNLAVGGQPTVQNWLNVDTNILYPIWKGLGLNLMIIARGGNDTTNQLSSFPLLLNRITNAVTNCDPFVIGCYQTIDPGTAAQEKIDNEQFLLPACLSNNVAWMNLYYMMPPTNIMAALGWFGDAEHLLNTISYEGGLIYSEMIKGLGNVPISSTAGTLSGAATNLSWFPANPGLVNGGGRYLSHDLSIADLNFIDVQHDTNAGIAIGHLAEGVNIQATGGVGITGARIAGFSGFGGYMGFFYPDAGISLGNSGLAGGGAIPDPGSNNVAIGYGGYGTLMVPTNDSTQVNANQMALTNGWLPGNKPGFNGGFRYLTHDISFDDVNFIGVLHDTNAGIVIGHNSEGVNIQATGGVGITSARLAGFSAFGKYDAFFYPGSGATFGNTGSAAIPDPGSNVFQFGYQGSGTTITGTNRANAIVATNSITNAATGAGIANGKIYGDGSPLTNISPGQLTITPLTNNDTRVVTVKNVLTVSNLFFPTNVLPSTTPDMLLGETDLSVSGATTFGAAANVWMTNVQTLVINITNTSGSPVQLKLDSLAWPKIAGISNAVPWMLTNWGIITIHTHPPTSVMKAGYTNAEFLSMQ